MSFIEKISRNFLKASANTIPEDYSFHKLPSHQKCLKKHMLGSIIKTPENSKTENIGSSS